MVLVDTKLPGFGAGILEQVRSVTAKPITMIINTHTHADHTGGNPELPRNVEHIAQQNTRGNMAKMDLFKAANEGLLPTRTFTDRLSLLSGADRIDLYYFGPGHTNGDAIVVFPALRVAATGDLFARKWAPLVDAPHGRTASPNTNNQHKSHAGQQCRERSGIARSPAMRRRRSGAKGRSLRSARSRSGAICRNTRGLPTH